MSDERPVINWDRPMLERFKQRHATAVLNNEESFTFDGHEFVRDYAKYLIQYLDPKLPKKGS